MTADPMLDGIDPEDIDELITGANDLLFAGAILDAAKVDPILPAESIALLLGVLRNAATENRSYALVLRRQPTMAARIADHLEQAADTIEDLLPATPADLEEIS